LGVSEPASNDMPMGMQLGLVMIVVGLLLAAILFAVAR
jgi:hypothetical protein